MFYNKVTLVGRIGKMDSRSFKRNGKSVSLVNMNLAVSRNYTDDDGNRETDWVRVSAFGKLAEIIGEYAEVGRLILVEGELRVNQTERTYELDIENEAVEADVPVTYVSVLADQFRFMDKKKEQSQDEDKPAKARTGGSRKKRKATVRGTNDPLEQEALEATGTNGAGNNSFEAAAETADDAPEAEGDVPF